MKTYNDRTKSVLEKAKNIRKRNATIVSSVCCMITFLLISAVAPLFIPYSTTPPSIAKYAGTEYYNVITKINDFTFQPPEYTNRFEELVAEKIPSKDTTGDLWYDTEEVLADSSVNAPLYGGTGVPPGNGNQTYEEVTDNQVNGVIEGDIFKRSNRYVYFLRNRTLSIYSIAGLDSCAQGSFQLNDADGYALLDYAREMYLSEDCKTVTILTSAYAVNMEVKQKVAVLINLDVSDPANITETGRAYLTGDLVSSRLTDGTLLVVANYTPIKNNIDFDIPATFIPQYGTADNMHCIEGSNIVTPTELTTLKYTVVCMIDGNTLEITSSGAFLSYSNEIYVSENKIYTTRSYRDTETIDPDRVFYRPATEITALDYADGKLTPCGSVSVAGSVKNQYSLDEYENILRVATTTGTIQGSNASLYCIDLSTWKTVAAVENFAPYGETVRSVRFDKNKAYVCTAVELTDPVFSFDLTDLDNIVVKDTGTISGYSTSLVNFGAYLLGIGIGSRSDTLKIELYEESGDEVSSVAVYEVPGCSFLPSDYKSYYINREDMQLGIAFAVYDTNGTEMYPENYVLLQFDGYGFAELIHVALNGVNDNIRAFAKDGYFYIFDSGIVVKPLF